MRITAIQALIPFLLSLSAAPLFASEVHRFEFTAPTDGEVRRVFVYLPTSIRRDLKQGRKIPAVLFLHGGGASTDTPAKAEKATFAAYLPVLQAYGEKSRKIVVLPLSHFGWNVHTRYFLRALIPELARRFPVRPDRIVLAGHSMGAMGITREFPFVHDLFMGVAAFAGGTADGSQSKELLGPYFTTPYFHQNGADTRLFAFDAQMQKLVGHLDTYAATTGEVSLFHYRHGSGPHSIIAGTLDGPLNSAFRVGRRQPPRAFHAVFDARNLPDLIPPLRDAANVTAFWLTATDFDRPASKTPSSPSASAMNTITAAIRGQSIAIQIAGGLPGQPSLNIRRLRLTLDDDLIDLNSPVEVRVNEKIVYRGMPTESFEVSTTSVF